MAQVAAVVVAVLLVGSLLLVFHMAQANRTAIRPHQTTRTAGQSASPSGIYISRADGVYRLNIQTRKVIWHTHVAGQSLFAGDPVVIGDTLYIITDGPVSALDALTGALRWSHDFHGRVIDPYLDKGLLYFRTLLPLSNALYAVNAANGTIIAIYTPDHGQEWGSPIVVKGVLYYVAGSAYPSTLYAVQLPEEKILWQQKLSNVSLVPPRAIFVQNNVLYIQFSSVEHSSLQGKLETFDAHTGNKLWPPLTLAKGVRIITITDTMIYAATFDGNLLAFDAHTYTLVWQKPFDVGYLEVASGKLYIDYGRNGVQLAALNASTGKLLWQQSKSNGLGLVGILNGVVYGENWPNDGKDGTIYAFSASNGSQLWTMSIGVPNVQWGGMIVA